MKAELVKGLEFLFGEMKEELVKRLEFLLDHKRAEPVKRNQFTISSSASAAGLDGIELCDIAILHEHLIDNARERRLL